MRRAILCLCSLVFFAGCEEDEGTVETGGEDTDEVALTSFEVTGWIVDDWGEPVEEAMVLVGGRQDTLVYSGSDGSFSLWYTEAEGGEPAIIAGKSGYRSRGFEFFKPDTPITISLRYVSPVDNLEYVYEDPGDGFDHMEENCSHCHTSFVADFLSSAHAEAARNPLVQDLYAGVTRRFDTAVECEDAGGAWRWGLEPGTEGIGIEKCYLGGGVLSDLNETCGGEGQLACDDTELAEVDHPEAFGACADCHAPGINGVAGGRDLHEAVGVAYEIGVHCDVCHKVRDVDMSQPPGVGQRLVMGRPSEPGQNAFIWSPVAYGPLIDVANVVMGGSPQPKFNQSVYCAGCHEQDQDALLPGEVLNTDKWPQGLPIHDTYGEWQAGPYNQDETQCQHCHMPANVELTNSVDITRRDQASITFGFIREPEDIRTHIFRGPLEGAPRLIDTSAYVSVKTNQVGETLTATVSVANIGCGHALPTGEPMRALLLHVEAEGDCGTLEATGGLTIPDTGGALVMGEVGVDVAMNSGALQWAAASEVAVAGQVVRVVRPTGQFDDYSGIGFFADESLTPPEKGMEIQHPVGEATVMEVEGEVLTLSEALPIELGDRIYLGDAWTETPEDGQASRSIAGRPGYAFSKVLLDSAGNRHVPHYRAVDMASDNRIAPGTYSLTHHEFEVPSGCSTGTVRASLWYRPVPLNMARLRGWDAQDYQIALGLGSW